MSIAAAHSAMPPGDIHHGLAMVMTGLILFVATIVAVFSRRYMRADPKRERFYALLAMVAGATLTFVWTDNLVLFALGWVISGLLLARLIGHVPSVEGARVAQHKALTTFAIGDGALVLGLTLLAWSTRSLSLPLALERASELAPALVMLIGLLLVTGAAARCALPPFAGWLLSSMTAPTPVSALMHAGLVNAGGILLIRFAPLLELAPDARIVAAALGLVASLYGLGIMAISPTVKRSLAGSTVSQMGFMLLSCALGAYAAALWHIVAHGLFKAWLFLGSGASIGVRKRKLDAVSPLRAGVVAMVTLLMAGAAWAHNALTSGFVPLALAITTSLTLLTGVLAEGSPRHMVMLMPGLAALLGSEALGLTMAQRAVGSDGPALLAPAVQFALLAGWLALWVWQQRRQAARLTPPPGLYVRLLNAGATGTPSKGVLP